MAMPGYKSYTATPQQSRGMAVASLVLGLVGLPALLLCGAGLPLAMVGLVLGVIAAVRNAGRGVAIAGICASIFTLVVGALAIFWLLAQAAECADQDRYPSDTDRQRCVEHEFPFAKTTATP